MSAFRFARRFARGVAIGTTSLGLAAAGAYAAVSYNEQQALLAKQDHNRSHVEPKPFNLPTRAKLLSQLKSGEEYDVLVVGGGATGAGVALDAASRGLRTALVERDDYSSGTSSRSTKLIHGGVRYLEKAVWQLDYGQYELVREALHERAHLLRIAPHLSFALPIMIPLSAWWQVPYYWAGSKCYDLVAGRQRLEPSYYLPPSRALEAFPMLKGDGLWGAMIYYDGSHNDARMCLAIALTAVEQGAVIANHTAVTRLLKRKAEKAGAADRVCGVEVEDQLTGEKYEVKAKCVVNATGPFCDSIRKLDDPATPEIVQPSSGVHVVLPGYYSPHKMGLLDPATSDGRVIFFLPWLNSTIAGTTDAPTTVSERPMAREEEITFIMNEIKNYLNDDIAVRRGDVLAAWAGIRPLVSDPDSGNTENITRTHLVTASPSGLLTIAGGKWTTYRAMAADCVDFAVKHYGLKPTNGCVTEEILLHGAEAYTPTLFIRVVQQFGLSHEVAEHLVQTYGDKAFDVAKLAAITGKHWPVVGKRLSPDYPYIEAEVRHAVREYARTATDIIARRTRLAFLNVQAGKEALPRIVQIMAEELGWDAARQKAELDDAMGFLMTTGLGQRKQLREKQAQATGDFTVNEVMEHRRQFDRLSKEHGTPDSITLTGLQRALHRLGQDVDEPTLLDLVAEVDLDNNGSIEFEEYLQLMRAIKTGKVVGSRLAAIAQKLDPVSTERSGGGV